MLFLLQLVKQADVVIDNKTVAAIAKGLLVFVGIQKEDNLAVAEKLLQRALNYRIFPDGQGRMNLSLKDVEGGLLLVPQFTLVADTQSGLRPGFSRGMPPEEGHILFDEITMLAKKLHTQVEVGKFGAHMQVNLCNDGPATFILHHALIKTCHPCRC